MTGTGPLSAADEQDSVSEQDTDPQRRGIPTGLIGAGVAAIAIAFIAFKFTPGPNDTSPVLGGDLSGSVAGEDSREVAADERSTAQRVGIERGAIDAIRAVGGRMGFDEENRLYQLTLRGPFITDDVMRHVIGQTSLEGVILEETKITDAGFAHLADFINLRRLAISSTTVTDTGVAYLQHLTALEGLKIQSPNVTDAGAIHLRGLTQLRVLNLDNTQVGDEGFAHVAGLTQLEEVSLFKTRVSDASIRYLKGLPHLKRLCIQSTNITDDGMAQLLKAFPECVIQY